MADDTPTAGVSIRPKRMEGLYVPLIGVFGVIASVTGFLFERIETKTAEITAQMVANRNEVGALAKDVVRLQDQQANTSVVLAEIKGDVREILVKLDRLDRHP